ncbi:MAG: TetR/AcrR family transcriptional regulator [Bacteroidales bacterium]|nr:TetR/AcrR family transcriptional regulator [Bacteroidales bacterium]MDD4384002.1 TetR/AcrR family transcriptional regulator [Bacteroidales bacterium]MDY0198093.1 TetR/AcrR family transcriptional regulator [Tenuifilaceae bacterium]
MLTARQQEIIEASLELISTIGIQGFTIKNLSKKIGVTEPAIYRHYENKISILLAILDYFKARSELLFIKQVNDSDSSLDRIEKIFQGHFNAFEKTPSLVNVIFSEEIFRNEPILQEKITDIMDRNSGVIKAIVAEGQARGEIKSEVESKYLTLIILGSLRMMVKRWQMGDKSFNHSEEVSRLFNTIKNLIEVK